MTALVTYDEEFGDLRQGVSRATHLALDRAEALADETPSMFVFELLELARKAAAAACRACPDVGTGARRVHRAQEAAALLLVALNRMDANGRQVVP